MMSKYFYDPNLYFMKNKVGRPPLEKKKISVSLKIDSELNQDLLDLAAINYSDRTKMIEQCLRTGLPAFIREAKLENKLHEYRTAHKEPKKRAM